MKLYVRFGCLLMSVVLVFSLAGCDNVNLFGGSETSWREPYQEETTPITKDFVDTDGDFKFESVDWNGPSGYVIIVPAGDTETKTIAEKLKAYYSAALGVSVNLNTDAAKKTAKEIVIGNTNRAESKNELKENELEVSVTGDKLVFSAGHNVTLNSAVEKYIRTAPQKNKASVFKLTTDFSATALDGYKYVWGDEFEGSDVDYTKWDYEVRMDGTVKMEVSYDKNVINVEDGRLKLHALKYYNPERKETQYRVPYAVLTKYKMNYVYGYAEIRCRLPFFKGVWPSFWTQSTDVLSGKKLSTQFMAEVDIFEVFGTNEIIPGIIKWYHNDGGHAFYGDYKTKKVWTWENTDTIETEYHTYGWEWTKDKMTMYVDGEAYMDFDMNDNYDGRSDMSGFHDPMFLMFNNHLITDDSWQSGHIVENSDELLPACFYIDYIRLYQKDDAEYKLYIDETDTSAKYSDRK